MKDPCSVPLAYSALSAGIHYQTVRDVSARRVIEPRLFGPNLFKLTGKTLSGYSSDSGHSFMHRSQVKFCTISKTPLMNI